MKVLAINKLEQDQKLQEEKLALEKAKLDAVMLEKNPSYNSLTDKVFGKQEGWSFTRLFSLGGYTILGVILGRYVAKNMGKSTNLGMVIGGVLPYVAYKLSLEYDKKQFSKQPQQAPKQPVDMSELKGVKDLGGGKDKFGMPILKSNTIEEERAFAIQFFKTLPDEFTIENTRFFKNSNLEFYKQSFSSSGFGAGTPIKISGADFSNAHIEFKNRNTPNKFSESLKSFLEKQPQGVLATPNIYKF